MQLLFHGRIKKENVLRGLWRARRGPGFGTGRVNLIGEHTDYNNGYVLPAAIAPQKLVFSGSRPDSQVRIWADDFREEETFSLEAIVPSEDKRWANYVKGFSGFSGRRASGCRGLMS